MGPVHLPLVSSHGAQSAGAHGPRAALEDVGSGVLAQATEASTTIPTPEKKARWEKLIPSQRRPRPDLTPIRALYSGSQVLPRNVRNSPSRPAQSPTKYT